MCHIYRWYACVEIRSEQRLLKMAMDNGNLADTKLTEPSKMEPTAETEFSPQGDEKLEERVKNVYPFAKGKARHGPQDAIEVVYAQVNGLLDWEALARITQSLSIRSTHRRVIMDQGAWRDE